MSRRAVLAVFSSLLVVDAFNLIGFTLREMWLKALLYFVFVALDICVIRWVREIRITFTIQSDE